MIAIVNYGLGNLRSVAGAVERLGFEPVISDDPAELSRADKLILPGVGAFGEGMDNLHKAGLVPVLNRLVLEQGRPVLGICLGFQLMAREGREFGVHAGLGWLDATVNLLEAGDLRLPHVGWNDLFPVRPCALLEEIPEDALFYYVHSYHVCCTDREDVVGECEYGQRFTAVASRGNIHGAQFHPEKSQQWGLRLLQNFLEQG